MRRPCLAVLASVAIGCGDAVAPGPPPSPRAQTHTEDPGPVAYEVVYLGALPFSTAQGGEAMAINNRGQIVGWSGPGDPSKVDHAFLWDSGVMTNLGPVEVGTHIALFINERGQVAGGDSRLTGSQTVPPRTFVWDGGVRTDIGTLGGTSCHPSALSQTGAVVGSSRIGRDARLSLARWGDAGSWDAGRRL
jgi:probable HAF family extracellular repeat protein